MDRPSFAQPPSPEIDYLYRLQRGTVRLGLGSTRRLLGSLGNPERALPMAHVAGTNGKGSATALAAAMLQAGGNRVGRYTSPHVLRVEERICLDGRPIGATDLRARVRELRPFIDRARASFFEAMTAIAAMHFRDAGADTAVYEVGIGGRLDATNAIPSSVSVLTSVGHDHEAVLGRGLRAVCREKLGIVKPGVPLFAALERADLVRLARATCARKRAPLTLLPADAGRVIDLDLETGTTLELRFPEPCRLVTPLLGAHQLRNVALAAAAVRSMQARGVLARPPRIAAGAARAFLPGRFQVLPAMPGWPTIVLDVGHNPEALEATLDVAELVLGGVRPVVLLGLLEDKKLGNAAKRLARIAGEIVLTEPTVDRAWDARAGMRLFPTGRSMARRRVIPKVADAVDHVLGSGSSVILVLGSHYLLGEALPVLAARRGVDPARLLQAPDRSLRAAG